MSGKFVTPVLDKEIDVAELQYMQEWLAERGLKKYTTTFVQNEVYCLNDIALLTSEDLVEMGIKAVGARRKLLCHTAQLKGEISPKQPESPHIEGNLPPLPQKNCQTKKKAANAEEGSSENRIIQHISDEVNNWDGLGVFCGLGDSTKQSLKSLPTIAVGIPLEHQEDLHIYSTDLAPVFAELAGEIDVLQSISDDASLLLTYEKEDSVVNDTYVPGHLQNFHTIGVDVAFFRDRIEKRIKQFMRDPSPPPSPRTQARQWAATQGRKPRARVDYKTLINQQTAVNKERDRIHARYQELLERCLDSVMDDLDKHSNVGEYRDAGEYRLKMQLARLIGMAEPPTGAELEAEEKDHRARLGITDATLHRRRSTQQHLENLVQTIDGNGNGIVMSQKIKEACEQDAELKARVAILAFNLALDPENRFVGDNDNLNVEIQAELEMIASKHTNEEGLIDQEAFNQMSPHCRNTLIKFGLPAVFSS